METMTPERIIPFTTTRDDVKNTLTEMLIKKWNVPTDIFTYFKISDIRRFYVPMFLFEGKFTCTWAATIRTTSHRPVYYYQIGNPRSLQMRREYTPTSGQARDNFAILCPAYEGEEIPEDLYSNIQSFTYKAEYSKEYTPELAQKDADTIDTLPQNADPEVVWAKYGDKAIDMLALRAAGVMLDKMITMDVSSSSNYEFSRPMRMALVSFWYCTYKYGKTDYYFIMDGAGDQCFLTAPQEGSETEEAQSSKNVWRVLTATFVLIVGVLYYFDVITGNARYYLIVLWLFILAILYGGIQASAEVVHLTYQKRRKKNAEEYLKG